MTILSTMKTKGKHTLNDADGEIVCTERLGGLLKYYHRVRRAV